MIEIPGCPKVEQPFTEITLDLQNVRRRCVQLFVVYANSLCQPTRFAAMLVVHMGKSLVSQHEGPGILTRELANLELISPIRSLCTSCAWI